MKSQETFNINSEKHFIKVQNANLMSAKASDKQQINASIEDSPTARNSDDHNKTEERKVTEPSSRYVETSSERYVISSKESGKEILAPSQLLKKKIEEMRNLQ